MELVSNKDKNAFNEEKVIQAAFKKVYLKRTRNKT